MTINPLVAQAISLVGTPRAEKCPFCGAPPSAATKILKSHSALSAAKAVGAPYQQVMYYLKKQKSVNTTGETP